MIANLVHQISDEAVRKENWWKLVPLEPNGNVYLRAKLHAIDVSTRADVINFKIQLLVNSKSILPNNIMVATLQIPEYKSREVELVVNDAISNELDWHGYDINVTVAKKELSYGNEDLKSVTVPIKITLGPNITVLKDIQSQLEPNALKQWMQNMYDAVLNDEVKLSSYFRIHDISGKTQLYQTYPTNIAPGQFFTLSWNMNYYMRMTKLDTLRDLFSFTATIPSIISNVDIMFYYNVPQTNGYKTLKSFDRASVKVDQNTTHLFRLPYKVLYNSTTKELFESNVAGHDVFFPQGASGYYDISFKMQTDKTFYTIALRNNFNYLLPLDAPQQLDFFKFNYHPITSLNGFNRV